MMIKPTFPERPGYPETLKQSIENPTQLERLPKTRPTLEHRLRLTNLAARRTLWLHIAWSLAWRILLIIAIKAVYFFFPTWVSYLYLAVVLLGVVSVAQGLLAHRNALVRWSVYLTVCPALALTWSLADRPYFELALALVALTALADALATHYLRAHTAAGLRGVEKRHLRTRWKNRFALFQSARRTVRWYPAVLATPLWLWGLLTYWSMQPTRLRVVQDLYLLLWGAALLGLVSLAGEPLLGYLYNRPLLSPRRLLRIAFQALGDWLTYNPRDLQVPAIFVSPGGPIQARQAFFYGVLTLLVVSIVDLSNYQRPPDPRIAVAVSRDQLYQQALRERLDPAEAAALANNRSAADVLNDEEESRDALVPIVALVHSPFTTFLAFLLVPIYLVGCILPALGRAAALVPATDQLDSPAEELSTEDWNRFVEHLRTSSDPTEKTSLFLGLNALDHSPVIVPRTVFQEHAHILGDSGSGKTALGISPLMAQLIRAGDCSIVLLDLKGDDTSLFENARLEAEHAGLPFRWFTNELGRATYAYNPLDQSHLSQLSLYQRTDLLTASLGLQYGTDYGRGYFSDANAEMLFHALRAHPEMRSFRELAYVLRQREPFRALSAQLKTAGAHLSAIVSRLAATEALNVHPRQTPSADVLEQAIDMRAAFETPQVIYFHLSSALGTSTTAEIARMAMFSLLTASKFVSDKRRQVFLIVDEFQRVVSNNLELFLQTARSMNIGVILANQSLSDLRKPDVDIISTVRTNTRFRQLFSVGEMRDFEEVIFTSGETLLHGRSWQESMGLTLFGPSGLLRTRTTSEVISPRLRVNDVLLASDHPKQNIAYVRRGDGYAQFGGFPFVMASSFHISQDEYERRKRAAWPTTGLGTFVPTRQSTDEHATLPPSQPDISFKSADTATRSAKAASSTDEKPTEPPVVSEAVRRLFEQLDQHYQEQQAGRGRPAGPPAADDLSSAKEQARPGSEPPIDQPPRKGA